MVETLIWLLIWSTMLWGIGMLRKDLAERQPFKALLLPGLLLDAAIRGFSYLLTATPVKDLSPLAPGRPVLSRENSKIQYLGLPLSLVLRMLTLVGVTYYLLLDHPDFLESEFTLPLLDKLSVESNSVHWESLSQFWSTIAELPGLLGLAEIGTVILLYTLCSYFLGAALTTKEYVAALSTCGAIAFLCWIGTWLGVTLGFMSRGWFLRMMYVPEFYSTFSLLVVISLASLGLTAVLRFVCHILTVIGGAPDRRPAGARQ